MAYTFPSSTNVFVPSADATGNLIIGFSRNVESFPINRWLEMRPVTRTRGFYWTWASQQAARVRFTDGREFVWPDGADSPTGTDNLEAMALNSYETVRYAPSFTLGDLTVDQADWPIVVLHSDVVSGQLMTLRALQAYNSLVTTAWGTNSANVDGAAGTDTNGNAPMLASGQNWTNGSDGIGTNNAPNILITLNKASQAVALATLGVVRPRDLIIVMNPYTASIVGQSPEVQGYVRSSRFARDQLQGTNTEQTDEWGCPPYLHGHPVVVDDTVQNSAQKSVSALPGTPNNGWVIPNGTVYLITRKNANGNNMIPFEGAPREDYEKTIPVRSTLVMFTQEEFTAETKHDVDNRTTKGRVVTNYQIQAVSPLSAFQLTHCLG